MKIYNFRGFNNQIISSLELILPTIDFFVPSLHDGLARRRDLLPYEPNEADYYGSEDQEIFNESYNEEGFDEYDENEDRPFSILFFYNCESIEFSKSIFQTNKGFKNIIVLKESSISLIEDS